MKTTKLVSVLVLFWISSFSLSAQILVSANKTISRDTLFTTIQNNSMSSKAVNASGQVEFYSNSGYVRILLSDDYGYDLLVYESTPLVAIHGIDIFNHATIETIDIPSHLAFTKIRIEVKNAELKNLSVETATTNISTTQQQQTRVNRIALINSNLRAQNALWEAGETSMSHLSFEEKKGMFGGSVPDLQGFEYYVGGIFELMDENGMRPDYTTTTSSAPMVSKFDWRNRHGKNWVTSVKDQYPCGTCWIFTAIGAVEGLVNLYYNKLLNLDLSEQQMITCYGRTCGTPGWAGGPLQWITADGVVDEDCFSYDDAENNPPCSNKCNNPAENIKIAGHEVFYPGHYSDPVTVLKKLIIQKGIIAGVVSAWLHEMTLVGFGTVQEGDTIKTILSNSIIVGPNDSLIGKTYWIFKNSYGISWGNNGYGYVVLDINKLFASVIPLSPVTSLNGNYTDADIACVDKDGDGYYYWGIGPKPATCPCWAPDEPDGDDSDPSLGPMDEFGHCLPITPLPNSITESITLNADRIIHRNITIQSGGTLTIKSTLRIAPNVSIDVRPGGKLIVDGGTLTNACEGKTWDDILILGDPTRPMEEQHQGVVKVINHGKIENARFGIRVDRSGIVIANNAHFVNNTVGVRFYSDKGVGIGKFTQTEFKVDGNYFSNEAFDAHIKMENSGSVLVRGCTFSSTAPRDDSGKNRGIYVSNTDLEVKELCPPGSPLEWPTGFCAGNTVYCTIFEGFTYAISAHNTGSTPNLKVRFSKFKNNRRGISVTGINYPELIKNVFTITQSNSYGVVLKNATGYMIEGNLFKEEEFGSKINSIGLWISNSGSVENEVYKNEYENLCVAQQFSENNAYHFMYPDAVHSQPLRDIKPGSDSGLPVRLGGLQTLCNIFHDNRSADIFVGYSTLFAPYHQSSIKKNQGNMQKPAGNWFDDNPKFYIVNIDNKQSKYTINYYYDENIPAAEPKNVDNVFSIPISYSNGCPSKLGTVTGGGIPNALAQYNNWDSEYEKWLAQLLNSNGDDEEASDMVSYYSALKDNLFNSIIVEASGRDGDKINQDSILENLRVLFSYRGNYIDYLSIVETFLAENDYTNALATLASMYKQFAITPDHAMELEGLEIYVQWLKQLEQGKKNIYELSQQDLEYLIAYANSNIGRGVVFAKIILCEIYAICMQEEQEWGNCGGAGEAVHGVWFEEDEIADQVRNDEEAPKWWGSLSENITLHPNPTTGELTITGDRLRITNVEIFDVYGRNVMVETRHALSLQLQQLQQQITINISHLNSGIYFVKITTDAGEVVKKVIKQ